MDVHTTEEPVWSQVSSSGCRWYAQNEAMKTYDRVAMKTVLRSTKHFPLTVAQTIGGGGALKRSDTDLGNRLCAKIPGALTRLESPKRAFVASSGVRGFRCDGGLGLHWWSLQVDVDRFGFLEGKGDNTRLKSRKHN